MGSGIWPKRTIVRDVALSLVLGTIAIAALASSVYWYHYSSEAERIAEQQADSMAERLSSVLALPLWNIDVDTIVTVSDAYFNAENVVALTVVDETGAQLYGKVRQSDGDSTVSSKRAVTYRGQDLGYLVVSLSKSRILERYMQAVYFGLLLTGVVVLGMVVLAISLLEPLLAKPIRRMTDGIKTIAMGSYDHSLPSLRQSDLDEIATQVNWMARQIAEREGRLQDLVRDLEERVAERERAEEALRDSKQRYEDLANLLPETVYEIDEGGAFTYLNRSGFESFGYGEEDLSRGLQVTQVFVPEDRPRVERSIREILAGERKRIGEYRALRKDGETFPLLAHSSPIAKGGRIVGLRGVAFDISDRKRSEEELARLAAALEQAAEAILITDRSGRIEYVNPAFETVFGLTGAAVGERSVDVLDEVIGARTTADILGAIREGNEWRGHLVVRHGDGRTREVEATLSPVTDERGAISHFVAVNRDVTEQVRLERQVRQTQKLEALGTLAGGIAHDFNNVLTPILGYTQVAIDDLPRESATREDLERVVAAAFRAKDLVAQILTFARQGESKRWAVQVGPIVKEVLKLLRASLPSTIEIRQRVDPNAGAVLGDPTQIHQVLLNLCTNASHAIGREPGVLEVALTEEFVDAEAAARQVGLREGPYVRLSVSDTGCGMSKETLDRIFEPFFTTKGSGEGTGMGLAVVHGIVQGYGGAIRVYSEPGKGSTFHVFLPRAEAVLGEERGWQEPPRRGRERLLVVDDEEAVVGTVKRFMEPLGYRVETATSSLAALELFRAHPGEFDVVISDLTMPGMTGMSLIEEVLRIRPGVPAILCTGLAGAVSPEEAREAGIRAVVMKPLTVQSLTSAVRRALGDGGSAGRSRPGGGGFA